MAEGWPSLPSQGAANGDVRSALTRLEPEALSIPTPKASARLRLSTIADCKREIRRLYIDARNGEISSAEAGRFVWMLNSLASLIVDHELEERLARLETK